MSIKRVLHIGGSGRIGQPVLQALFANGFDVTVATRLESQAVFPKHVLVVRVDYSSRQALVDAFSGQDAVVLTVGVRTITSQYKFIDAAVAAGVKRFIPSDFGCDCQNEKTAASPAYKERVDVTKYLQKLTEDPKINLTYASIATSIVIEAVLHGPLPSIDYRNRHATLFDGGDVPISMTPAPLVGEAVAAVLKNPELTENKTILVHGGAFTLRQVLTIAQKYVGKDNWKVDHQDTSKMEAESYEALSKTPEDALRWLPGLIRRCLFGEGFGGDFTGRTANEALGLKTLSEEDLDRYIENVIAADQKQ